MFYMTKLMLLFILIVLTKINAMVQLMMLLASHDADAGTSGITWGKICCIPLGSFWPDKWNDAIDETFGII